MKVCKERLRPLLSFWYEHAAQESSKNGGCAIEVIHVSNWKAVRKARKPKRYRSIEIGAVYSIPLEIREGMWTRDQTLAMYCTWIKTQPERLDLIRRLPEDAVLACVRKPPACHGDVLMEIWYELHEVST